MASGRDPADRGKGSRKGFVDRGTAASDFGGKSSENPVLLLLFECVCEFYGLFSVVCKEFCP